MQQFRGEAINSLSTVAETARHRATAEGRYPEPAEVDNTLMGGDLEADEARHAMETTEREMNIIVFIRRQFEAAFDALGADERARRTFEAANGRTMFSQEELEENIGANDARTAAAAAATAAPDDADLREANRVAQAVWQNAGADRTEERCGTAEVVGLYVASAAMALVVYTYWDVLLPGSSLQPIVSLNAEQDIRLGLRREWESTSIQLHHDLGEDATSFDIHRDLTDSIRFKANYTDAGDSLDDSIGAAIELRW